MKKLLFTLIASAAVSGAAYAAAEPIITFRTNIYEQQGDQNLFSLRFGAKETTTIEIDCGQGKTKYQVDYADFNASTGEINPTWIYLTVNFKGTVKIYGDPALIDYIDFEGVYMSEIEFPKLTDVEILNLRHNELQSLDLSHMHKLQYIDVAGNYFEPNAGGLTIGKDKPGLTVLNISMSSGLNPGFNLSDYPAIASFQCYSNPSLTELDPTGCPDLIQLSIDSSNVAALDVTKNPKLRILNVSGTKVSNIDLSHNPMLTEFYCTHNGSMNTEYQFTDIDVTHNPSLTRLFCSGNRLTGIDLSKNSALNSLYIDDNYLEKIDLSANSGIYELNVAKNYFNYYTLPAPSSEYITYVYYQRPMKMDRSYKEGTVLDFTKKTERRGTITTAVLYAVNRDETASSRILDESYYSYENGIITLNKACEDSVYFVFQNSLFNEENLQTEKFKIKKEADFGKPNPMINFKTLGSVKTISFGVGIAGASEENPKPFFVDFGNGKLEEFAALTENTPAAPNAEGARSGNTCTVYIPEGDDITAFAMSGIKLTQFDMSEAETLKELTINKAILSYIDTKWNRSLTRLDLADNMLTSLDLTSGNSLYDKKALAEINVHNNRINTFTPNSPTTWRTLDFSDNKLTEFLIKTAWDLEYLDISNNQLTELDLEDNMAISYLNIENNLLTRLPIAEYNPLETLNIAGNDITFSNLPPVGRVDDYTYAPQRPVMLPEKAPAVNLSSEWFSEDNKVTNYRWLKEDGTPLNDTQIRRGSNGRFTFLDQSLGKVYCEMSHPLFPQFEGENIQKTTLIEVAPKPDEVSASFVTLDNGTGDIILTGLNNGDAVYVDWTGEGDLDQYILKGDGKYTIFDVEYYAGKTVRMYSYEEIPPIAVFSLSAGRLGEIDASGLKNATSFMIYGSGLSLDKIKFPEADLEQLALENTLIENIDLSQFPNLEALRLSHNRLKSIDLSGLSKLEVAFLSDNRLEEVKISNPVLWGLDLSSNLLTEIDLSAVPQMNQLVLDNNKLSEIDVDALGALQVLSLSGNKFTLATLPLPQPAWNLYYYSNQAPINAEVEDECRVDLGEYSQIGGNATVYRWFKDAPYYDEEGKITGSELIKDEQYVEVDGTFKFLKSFENIMCVMTNETFPNLVQLTNFINVKVPTSTVEGITSRNVSLTVSENGITVTGAEGIVRLFTADGKAIGTGAGDNVQFGPLAPGLYIVSASEESFKIKI